MICLQNKLVNVISFEHFKGKEKGAGAINKVIKVPMSWKWLENGVMVLDIHTWTR